MSRSVAKARKQETKPLPRATIWLGGGYPQVRMIRVEYVHANEDTLTSALDACKILFASYALLFNSSGELRPAIYLRAGISGMRLQGVGQA